MLCEVLVGNCDCYKKDERDVVTNNKYSLCLLSRATREPSALHTTYLTGGVVISAMVFCCWISYSTTEAEELRIRLAVPP